MEMKTMEKNREQRIRGPNLVTLIPFKKPVPFEEGLARANSENKVIASNKRLSQTHEEDEEWKTIGGVSGSWSGTMVAYAKPGEKLGKAVEYVDPITGCIFIFPVPEAYQDKKDAIIVAEHPDYNLELKGMTRIVRAAHVELIENFPAEEGWYRGDPKHDIPFGDQLDIPTRTEVEASPDIRKLCRIEDTTFVGPVTGHYGGGYFGAKRFVGYYHWHKCPSAMIVEALAQLVSD